MVFRDHYLSNRIGFEYQHFRPEDAAADLVHRLHKIAENLDWSERSIWLRSRWTGECLGVVRAIRGPFNRPLSTTLRRSGVRNSYC